MEDKEVGELWLLVTTNMAENFGDHGADMIDLICKMVEERTYFYGETTSWTMEYCSHRAIKDFGIDPESFK